MAAATLRAGSLSSSLSSSVSMADLPNLPGVRRDVSAINPKLYKQFKASKTKDLKVIDENHEDDNSLMSFFDGSSRLQSLSRTLSPYPSQVVAYNDLNGRYSMRSQQQDRVNKTRSLPYSSTSSLPSFVRDDHRVCCFLGFFSEESRDEKHEISSRKVEIKFYTEDNTLEVIEPKVENSGMMQGKILKRHKIFKPAFEDNPGVREPYTLADIYSGARLMLYNRIYTIIDCDLMTRQFMEELGAPFGPSQPFPHTLYNPKTRAGMSRASTHMSSESRPKTKLGFFEYDRKVLRFYGVWDCRNILFGDELHVKLHYSLADDAIEIVPMNGRNTGRDRLPKYLKKAQYPKKPSAATFLEGTGSSVSSEGDGPPIGSFDEIIADTPVSPSTQFFDTKAIAAALVPTRPYHWTDLKIGETVSVASLSVVLLDADEFTREFYNSKEMPLDPPITLPTPTYPELQTTIPPYNGFGSEEDSLQTCKSSLMPHPILKDGLKAKLFQGMVLRYTAKFSEPTEADKVRQFIIQVHLEDDTIQIREPPIRNSGHKGGIFLARCKLETHDGSQPLQVRDIYVGGKVKILSHEFEILDCDQYTFKYMEDNSAAMWEYSHLPTISRKLHRKKEIIQRVLLTYPGLQSKVVTVSEMCDLLERSGVSLVRQEVCTIHRALDAHKGDTVKLTKLLKFVMDLK